MAKRFSSCILLIMYLSISMFSSTGNGHPQHHHAHDPMSHNTDEVNDPLYAAKRAGFFTGDDLYVGKTVGVQFYYKDPSSAPPFLYKDVADRIPFSSKRLPLLLQLFSIPPGTPDAQSVERTLKECEGKPTVGEQKICATSRESLVEFASAILGGGEYGVDYRFVKTTHVGKPVSAFQNYTLLDIKEVHTPIMIGCHIMDYPYAVYLCHSTETTRVYQILIAGDKVGDVLNAVAVCHIDTSQWESDHVSFKVLGVKQGTVPVCHFFGPHNPVWVKN